jgi:hypothetical protein
VTVAPEPGIPDEVVALAAALVGVSEAEALRRARRLEADAATLFLLPGRGGPNMIVGDDLTMMWLRSFHDLEWNVTQFRRGLRDGPPADARA